MNRLLSLCLALVATAGSAQSKPAPAKAEPYTVLYVFGDSYSDSGSGYIDGNGPTAVAYLARRLAIPFTFYGDPASDGKGLNFSVSGASSGEGTGIRYPTGEFLGFGMKNQVDNFVDFSRRKSIPPIDPANTLFFFAGGLNDGKQPEGFTRTNIEAEIETIYALGGRRFMVALLPVQIPAFTAAGIRANKELATIPADEKAKHPDIRIALSQWGPYFDEVITNPSKYGISDTTSQCAARPFLHEHSETCPDPETHFFYHHGHPSTAAHRAVGDMLYKEAITSTP